MKVFSHLTSHAWEKMFLKDNKPSHLFNSFCIHSTYRPRETAHHVFISVCHLLLSLAVIQRKFYLMLFTVESLDQSHDLFLLIVTYGFSESETGLCLPLLDDVRSLVLKDLLFDPQLSCSCQWTVHGADWSHKHTIHCFGH